jgi:hypothetical protein
MGIYQEQYWEPVSVEQVARRERRSGSYYTYLPDELVSRPLVASAELSAKASEAEAD